MSEPPATPEPDPRPDTRNGNEGERKGRRAFQPEEPRPPNLRDLKYLKEAGYSPRVIAAFLSDGVPHPPPPERARWLEALSRLLQGAIVVLYLGLILEGWLLHQVTMAAAFEDRLGWGYAVARYPLIGELYYLVHLALKRGTLFNPYSAWFFGFFALLGLLLAVNRAHSAIEDELAG